MEDSSPISTSKRAFLAAPDPDRYFPASAIEDARRKISRSLDRGEGPVLVIGGTGMGKSMLLEVLARQYYGKLSTVLLAGAQLCTRRALQQSILFQLGLPYREADEGELRLSLLSHLRPREGKPQRLLLLVDEAHCLPTRLLEELRALTNIAANGQLLVSLVLAGGPTLEERFAEPELDAFSQRVSQRCYLAAFGREETFQYLKAQVSAVGIKSSIFAQDGLEAIYAATDGVPRLVNQLGDQLVWLSDETGYMPIDGPIVQQAWSEIQQLPAPWNLKNSEPIGTSVEFGELTLDLDLLAEDAEDEAPSLIPMVGRDSALTNRSEESYFEPLMADDHLNDDLIEQFSDLEVANHSSSASFETIATANNPFQESFQSEEVVIDQYLDFESNLLASAHRVINRLDTAFAQQLKLCENPVVTDSPSGSIEICMNSDAGEATMLDEEFDGHSDILESLSIEDSCTRKIPSSTPGEILVIEDKHTTGPAIVSSKRFRQLFSSLETAYTPQRLA